MLLKKQELLTRVGEKVVAYSVGKFLSLHYDVHAPSCSIDSCLSLSGLSLAVGSGSSGRQFEGAREILKLSN